MVGDIEDLLTAGCVVDGGMLPIEKPYKCATQQ
jgi:hypothetical protein